MVQGVLQRLSGYLILSEPQSQGCGFFVPKFTQALISLGFGRFSCLPGGQSLSTKTKKARIAGFFSLPALISGIYISVTVALHKV
ncbi:hypothetical protein HUZ43_08295 [Raoultella ornithinolytica]|uniref:hypothetical protein n=1 Tax=Raoultella ornithinolytica TaxID=54291 RepID=UPI00113FD7FD|nr:hypothetical protein [Raoultella ornithinolytica]ULI42588.1 hypothetical protein HUZ43_08295 [Raoultella ornithinolytica]